MADEVFEFLAGIVKERSGLVLTPDKIYLLESRLTPVARRHGHSKLSELVAALRGTKDEAVFTEITEAMTTNESFFFRDKTPFEQFADIMAPGVLANRPADAPLRVWSAAASTGQEPYSICIKTRENPGILGTRPLHLIGTDISKSVLQKAQTGIYSQFEVQRGLPISLLVKYFEKSGEMWQINPDIRAMVRFQYLNLLHDFKELGKFDIIFCRNVLIYLDVETKRNVLDRMVQILEPDGFLVMGAAETIIGITDTFQPVTGQRGLFSPSGKAANAAKRASATA